MEIKILTVGKIKEKYLRDAISEYSKRLGRYVKLNIISVEDERTPDKASELEEANIKNTEGDRLKKHIKDTDFVIALAINGKMFSSVELSKEIDKLVLYGKSSLTFVIGGSLGICDDILNRANLLLSFSKMTFPHQLMQVILLEQIYRAFRISKNEPYHK